MALPRYLRCSTCLTKPSPLFCVAMCQAVLDDVVSSIRPHVSSHEHVKAKAFNFHAEAFVILEGRYRIWRFA